MNDEQLFFQVFWIVVIIVMLALAWINKKG